MSPTRVHTVFALVIFLLWSFVTCAQIVEGNFKVIGIADGDTMTLLDEDDNGKKSTLKVRLAEIDAPEKSQDFGQVAKVKLSTLCFGKQVKLVSYEMDRYGRYIGYVSIDGIDVNKEMVKSGLAWQYKKYSKDISFGELEAQARERKLNIWSNPNPVAPWEFRKIQKEN